VVPAVVLGLSLAAYQIALLADIAGPGTAQWLADGWGRMLSALLAPGALPTRLPQLVSAVLGIVVVAVLVAAWRAQRALPARRDQRGGPWWAVLATPFSGEAMADYFIGGLWDLLRGGANVTRPARTDLSRRYAELLADNLGQPGFRELLIVAHDLDARHDVVFALLPRFAPAVFCVDPRGRTAGRRRRSIWRAPRDVLLDARRRRAVDPGGHGPRPSASRQRATGAAGRTGSPIGPAACCGCSRRRPGGRAAGHHVAAARTRAGRTALRHVASIHARGSANTSRRRKPRRFAMHSRSPGMVRRDFRRASGTIRPPRWCRRRVRCAVRSLAIGEELVDRGYEDAYRQFVDPIVGASGDEMARNATLTSGE
jgi:hypothetical protein